MKPLKMLLQRVTSLLLLSLKPVYIWSGGSSSSRSKKFLPWNGHNRLFLRFFYTGQNRVTTVTNCPGIGWNARQIRVTVCNSCFEKAEKPGFCYICVTNCYKLLQVTVTTLLHFN